MCLRHWQSGSFQCPISELACEIIFPMRCHRLFSSVAAANFLDFEVERAKILS